MALSSINRNGSRKDKNESVFTKETLGVVLILFATLCLICLFSGGAIFSVPGEYVSWFLLGCFGYFAFVIDLGVIAIGVCLLIDKKIKFSVRQKVVYSLFLTMLALLVHTISMHNQASLTYGEYLASSYLRAQGGVATCSGGGVFTGLVAYLISLLLTNVGGYIILSLALAVLGGIIAYDIFGKKAGNKVKQRKDLGDKKFNSSYVEENNDYVLASSGQKISVNEYKEYPVANAVPVAQAKTQKLFVNDANSFEFKTKKEIKNSDKTAGLKIDFEEGKLGVGSAGYNYSEAYSKDLQEKLNYIKTPAQIDLTNTSKNTTINSAFASERAESYGTRVSAPIPRESVSQFSEAPKDVANIPIFEHDAIEKPQENVAVQHAEDFSNKYLETENFETPKAEYISPNQTYRPIPKISEEDNKAEENLQAERLSKLEEVNSIEEIQVEPNISKEVEEEPSQDFGVVEEPKYTEPTPPVIKERRARRILFGENETTNTEKAVGETSFEKPSFTSRVNADNNGRRGFDFTERNSKVDSQSSFEANVSSEPPKKEKKEVPINREYFRPPLDLLENYVTTINENEENHQERMEIIKKTLADFRIDVEPQDYVQGPTITRYEIKMAPGISVKRVLNYDDDLKMRLSAKDGVRIEAPIPGKDLFGVEVANKHKVTVGLREVLEGMAQTKEKPGQLVFAIGKDLVGQAKSDNLAKGPHYLVAGATGSGKSVALNVMIVSLIMRYSPEELRLILVDPKRVEFRIYEHIPHLMIDEIINEPKKVLATLTWAYEEMERRYKVFEDCGGMIVDINSYNENIAGPTVAKMPRIVIIIDELADLMESCKKELESRIRALAQKARSAGIHLVLATQRPSVDIITGTIKANLPSRIALKVMNYNDSQTILGEQGAEKLLGNGDMLFKNSTMPGYERYQGAWINTREINNIVTYIKEHNTAYFDEDFQEYLEKATKPRQDDTVASEDESGQMENNENNEFFLKALALAINSNTISISQLQRRFQIGYARAGGLIDKMERMGFISGNEGSKARKVFITREEFEQKFGPMPED